MKQKMDSHDFDHRYQQIELSLMEDLKKFNQYLEQNVQDMLYVLAPRNSVWGKKFPTMFKVYKKNQGLCDLVCNYLTLVKPNHLDDIEILLLNNDFDQLVEHFKLNDSFDYEKMETLSKTHTLLSISVTESLKYMFFNTIPNSIFSIKEQKKLIKKESNGCCLINEKLFNTKLEKLPIGSFVKFATFSKSTFGLPGTGHSRLIVKIREDKFIFIDPDDKKPECDSFSAAKLTDKVSEIVSNIKSSSYAFIDNVKFMNRFKTNSLKNLHVKKMF